MGLPSTQAWAARMDGMGLDAPRAIHGPVIDPGVRWGPTQLSAASIPTRTDAPPPSAAPAEGKLWDGRYEGESVAGHDREPATLSCRWPP